jgi:tRNA threonylcarbamoyl adenosine modification protein YeaZ
MSDEEFRSEYNIAPVLILALETATRSGSVAAIDTDRDLSVGHDGDAARTHGERLPVEVLDLLAAHGRTLRDVDRFAIVSGPGSFTGLRIGIAAMQGFAMAVDRRVQPVPTLDAIAEAWFASEPVEDRSGESRCIVSCLDGQRGDLFYAGWMVRQDQSLEHATAVIPPSVGAPADLIRAVGEHGAGRPLVVVGLGLDKHRDALAPLRTSIRRTVVPLAVAAARIASRRLDDGVAPHALRPIYIRRPDAVLARERAGLSARERS